jgi:Condensation domain
MPAETRYPLSPLQQGMLFHALYAPSSGVDIEQLVVQSESSLDLPRLRGAFEKLVARHGTLRTRLVWEGLDEPAQEVLPEIVLPFEQSALPLDDFLSRDRARGFTLSDAPLLRVTTLNEKTVVWRAATFERWVYL